jgi:hypothetical protein
MESPKPCKKPQLDWSVKARKRMGLPLSGCNLSTPEEASKFVQILVSAYPPYQRQGDYEVYLRMMAEACTGVPLPVLRDMVRPKVGLLGKKHWMPSVSDVVEWIEDYQRKFKVTVGEPLSFREEKFYDRNGKLIEGKTFIEPQTKEDRARHAAKLDALSATIRASVRAAQRANPNRIEPVQVHDPAALMASLENLDAMRAETMRGDE